MKKIQVKVIPRASKNEVIEIAPDQFKVKLTVAPVDGKANEALIELLSKHFKLSKSSVHILRGEKSQNKMIEIDL